MQVRNSLGATENKFQASIIIVSSLPKGKPKRLFFFPALHGSALFSLSINLLAFYRECCLLIGYAAKYLFCDR